MLLRLTLLFIFLFIKKFLANLKKIKFGKDALNWLKVTVKTLTVLQKVSLMKLKFKSIKYINF